jgi:hypothetical protein
MNILPKLFALAMVLALTSCGGFARVDPSGAVTIQGGVLSSITGLAVKVKKPDGTLIAYSQTGYEGENVANSALATISAVSLANAAYKTVNSNNVATTTQQANTLNAQTQQALNASNAATAQLALKNAAAKTAGQQANAIQLAGLLKKGPPAAGVMKAMGKG